MAARLSGLLGFGQEGFSITTLALAGVAALLVYYTIYPVKLDAREPPLVRPRIPFIGHLIGLMTEAHSYHGHQYARHKLPICTLPILGGKLYVVTDPALAHSAALNRSLSFDPFLIEYSKRLVDISDRAVAGLKDREWYSKWLKIIYGAMTGSDLAALNAASVRSLLQSFNAVPKDGVVVDSLWDWVRDVMGLASTDGLYGRRNPFRLDPGLTESYWAFERDLLKLLLGVAPKLLTPNGYAGRLKVKQAMTAYFASESDKEASVPRFTRDRAALERTSGFTAGDSGSLETAVTHAALSNSIPTAAWMMYLVLSDAALVQDLRAELEQLVEREDGRAVLDIKKLNTECPLLLSTFRETSRVMPPGELTRRILTDTTITDKSGRVYLLKKGYDLHAPYSVLHFASEAWGSDAASFNARRFLRGTDHAVADGNDILAGQGMVRTDMAPGTYMPFGGGKHLCPGRYFAQGEILGFVAPLLLAFDVLGPDGRPLQCPERANPSMANTMPKPVAGADLRGEIRRREGWEDVEWVLAD